jgi:hypothetical protein
VSGRPSPPYGCVRKLWRWWSWGAAQVREDFYGDQLGHIVMLDPEGNEFCVG